MDSKWSKWQKQSDKLSTLSSEFLEFVNHLDPNIEEKEGICGHWSAKDIVSHIAGWEEEVVARFKLFLEGPTEDIKYNIQSFNQKLVESRKHLSWPEVIEDLQAAQKELNEVKSNLQEENIIAEKRFGIWVNALIKHYKHHLTQIKNLEAPA